MKTYPDWMSANATKIGPYTLRDLVIPGSHDAGSWGARVAKIFGREAAEAQGCSVFDQLMAGSRYLDLRAKWVNGDYYMNHGVALTNTRLSRVLEAVRAFNGRYPKEIILITLSLSGGDVGKGYERARAALGPNLMAEHPYVGATLATSSIHDILSQSQVIFMQQWGDTKTLNRSGIYDEKAHTDQELLASMRRKINLMPDRSLWIWHITPPYYFTGPSLKGAAESRFKHFDRLLSSGDLTQYRLNILNCDFIGHLDWTGACLRANDMALKHLESPPGSPRMVHLS